MTCIEIMSSLTMKIKGNKQYIPYKKDNELTSIFALILL